MTHRSAHTEFRIVSMLVTVYRWNSANYPAMPKAVFLCSGYTTYSIPSYFSIEPDDVRREHELAVPFGIGIALGASPISSLGWLLQVLVISFDRWKRTQLVLFDRK